MRLIAFHDRSRPVNETIFDPLRLKLQNLIGALASADQQANALSVPGELTGRLPYSFDFIVGEQPIARDILVRRFESGAWRVRDVAGYAPIEERFDVLQRVRGLGLGFDIVNDLRYVVMRDLVERLLPVKVFGEGAPDLGI